MSDFLSTMAESSMLRARRARSVSSGNGLAARAVAARPPRPLRLAGGGFDLIAEAKLASPADGPLVATTDPRRRVTELARLYRKAGAAAVSVLTEPTRFGGHLGHLAAAAGAVDLPVMRKDFLVDPIQVVEARAAGASGVLLIARLTTPAVLREMTECALDFGMFVLVELFDEDDVERAAAVFDRDVLVGVNSRDLATLAVDPHRLATLAPLLPRHLPAVAESGIRSPGDAEVAAALGYRLALVGSGLVTSADPAAAAGALLAAGRLAVVTP